MTKHWSIFIVVVIYQVLVVQCEWYTFSNTQAPAVFGHTASEYSTISEQYDSFIIGGAMFNSTATLLNQYPWQVSVEYNRWRELQSPPTPQPRFRHASAQSLLTNSLYLFGGACDGVSIEPTLLPSSTCFLNDFWMFNITSEKWLYLDDSAPPSPRAGHSMVSNANGTALYIYGGYNVNGIIDDGIWRYDIPTDTWEHITLAVVPNTTASPEPRALHTAVAIDDNMLVFGGISATQVLLSDLWALDLNNATWDLRTSGGQHSNRVPTARAGHSAMAVPLSKNGKRNLIMLVFGGQISNLRFSNSLWLFEPAINKWSKIRTYRGSPPERGWAALTIASNGSRHGGHSNDDQVLFLFGGRNAKQTFRDTWVFDFTCDYACQYSSECVFGRCECTDSGGWFGSQCDSPPSAASLLLGLGLASAVPIVSIGWCVLHCCAVAVRVRALAGILLALSVALAAGVPSCTECWASVCIVGTVASAIGMFGAFLKSRSLKFALSYAVLAPLHLAVCIVGVALLFVQCNSASDPSEACGFDGGDNGWMFQYATMIAFASGAFLIITLPSAIKLARHRRFVALLRRQVRVTAAAAAGVAGIELSTVGDSLKTYDKKKFATFHQKVKKFRSALRKYDPAELGMESFSEEQLSAATSASMSTSASPSTALSPSPLSEQNTNNSSEATAAASTTSTSGSGEIAIVVRRTHLLEDAFREFSQKLPRPRDLRRPLRVTFAEEAGIDYGGLRREFFAELSRAVADPAVGLFTESRGGGAWIDTRSAVLHERHLEYFRFVGRAFGKAVFDGEVLAGVHFARPLYKALLGMRPSFDDGDLESVDPELHRGLKWLLDNPLTPENFAAMEDLTFSVEVADPVGVSTARRVVELRPGGANEAVTEANKAEFVAAMTEWKLWREVEPQLHAFVAGFGEVVPQALLNMFAFDPAELELLMCGLPDIDVTDWQMNTVYWGYSYSSPVVLWFWECVRKMTPENRARLLQFVTGTSRVPPKGFKYLTGSHGTVQKFTIRRAIVPPNHLPTAHTCFNQLDLPPYQSYEQLEKLLLIALNEGIAAFSLV